MKSCKKEIKINWGDSKSIKSGERAKKKLENQGYSLKQTKSVGLEKFVLVYKKGKC